MKDIEQQCIQLQKFIVNQCVKNLIVYGICDIDENIPKEILDLRFPNTE